jgi:predicted metal-dependent HD superfamily phosphohydrolase
LSDLNRWRALWARIGARTAPEGVHRDLERRYSEPHRAYHNLEHVADCLRQLDAARQLAENADAVELALWFHDVVYDTRASDNEQQSACLAREVLGEAGVSAPLISNVCALVIATEHHAAANEGDAQLVVDIDLSILGRSAEQFDRYDRAIRQEYAWVPDEVFRTTRAAILERFLQRPAIYSLPFFRDRYESQARRNLQRAIDRCLT